MGPGTCSDPSGQASTQGGVCAVADVAWGLGAGPGWSFMAPAAWMLLLGRPPAGAQGVAGLCWCGQAGRAMGDGAPCCVWSWVPRGGCCLSLLGAVKQQEVPLMPLRSLGGWRQPSPTQDCEYFR